MCIGLPFSILFVALIFMAQFFFRYFEREMQQGAEVEWYMHYVPGLINSFLIAIFGFVYKKISFKLIKSENHRY